MTPLGETRPTRGAGHGRRRALGHGAVALLLAGALALVRLGAAPGPVAAGPVAQTGGPNPIVRENQRPGDGGWYVANLTPSVARGIAPSEEATPETPATSAELWQRAPIEGYADRTSVERGGTLGLYVSTTAPRFDLTIYRMGWYDGQGGRQIQTVQGLPGLLQPVPAPDPATGLIAADWRQSYALSISRDWVSGVYLARLRADNETHDAAYILFVVRDDSQIADFVYKLSVNTYQAYNNWGGKSLYPFNSEGGPAVKVSFDRPYALRDGSGHFFHWDYPMIRWLEREGYNVTYITDVDAHTDRQYLPGRRALLTAGHDEYWSREMRDSWEAARNAKHSLAFFTGNDIYWQVRFEDSARGFPNRVMVCYRDASRDPFLGRDNSRLTLLWRDPLIGRPENALLGVMFDALLADGEYFPYVVKAADHWIFAGTGAEPGQAWSPIVGYEVDRVHDNGKTPPGLVILSESPLLDYRGRPNVSHSVYYQQGGMVFTAGTTDWSWALDDYWKKEFLDPRLQRTTANILDAFRAGAPPGSAASAAGLQPVLLAAGAAALAVVLVAAAAGWLILRRRAAHAPAEGWD